ncbi:MAG: O-antigen ligase family protein [Gemmatimonadota bacterium]
MTIAIPNPKKTLGRVRASLSGTLKLADDPYRRLMFLIVIMTISRIHQNFRFLNPLRPALTVTLLAAMYAYLNPKFLVDGPLTRTWPGKTIAGLFLAACLSVPFGISIGGSGKFILDEYIKTIVFGFLVIAAIRNTRDLYSMMWSFVIACGALSYLSLFVFKMQKASDDGLLRIQNGYSYDANDIATVAVTGLALALLMVQVCRGKGKVVAIAVVVGLGATIAKTGSRGGFLGLMVFGLALLLMLKTVPLAKRIIFLVVTALALIIAAPQGYWDQMLTIMSPTKDYNWTAPTGRKEVFKRGIGYMMRNPVTGIGIDNFPRAEGTLSERAIAQAADPSLAGIKWSVAHNSYLESATEMGVPGLILFCTLVFGGIFGISKLRRSLPSAWVTGTQEERFLFYASLYLPVAFAAFSASSFFVSFEYRDLLYCLGAFAAGLIVCIEQKLKAQASGGSAGNVAMAPTVRVLAPSSGPSLRFPQPPKPSVPPS